MLEGVHVETASQVATRVLLDAIVDGRIPAGSPLRLQDIAAQLGMSMMPIREAIRELAALDLVEIEPRRGARVREMSLTDLEDTYFSRIHLETIAVWEAAKRFTAEDAARAATALAEQEAAQTTGDLVRARDAHERFHFALYEAARRPWLQRSILPAWRNSERYRVGALLLEQTKAERNSQHSRILAALMSGDGAAAVTEMAEHLATSVRHSMAHMDGHEDIETPSVAEILTRITTMEPASELPLVGEPLPAV
jgi:DNA-binding GntR family transcriptional regulator